ncbi:MAG: putative peptidoglycan glycosyltransferase FtsW [Actinomycetaceae bacterium]|nr:putative peptidoglycan glycosyltransferase FtsW [Actinomycetaceae bacterium]
MATVSVHKTPTGRFSELFLLLISTALGSGAYVATLLGKGVSMPSSIHLSVGIIAVVVLTVHLIVRYFVPYADPVLLPTAAALNGIGLAMIFRLDLSYAALDRNTYGTRQLVYTALGIVLMIATIVLIKDHRKLRKYTYTMMVGAIALQLLPMLPFIGQERNGARIWVNLGIATFQPAEVAKICLAIFFAGYLVAKRDNLALGGKKILRIRLPRIRDLGPLLMVWGIALAVLILQHDLGTSLLLFGLFVAMLYVATNQVSWLILGALMFIPAAIVAATIFPHVGARFDVWLHPFDNEIYNREFGGSWQLVTGLFGMAAGGLSGTGWGNGHPQLTAFANSDFIFASLAEELGLTGTIGILLLYLIFVERGMRAATGVRDGFGKLLAAGLSFIVALQVFVIVGGITRVIPLTGLTLPFMAAGGSSLIVNWMILGILMRISDSARRPATHIKPVSTAELAKIIDSTPDSSSVNARLVDGEAYDSTDSTPRNAAIQSPPAQGMHSHVYVPHNDTADDNQSHGLPRGQVSR